MAPRSMTVTGPAGVSVVVTERGSEGGDRLPAASTASTVTRCVDDGANPVIVRLVAVVGPTRVLSTNTS